MNTNRSLLLIYTGGTIGMKENPLTGALAPFNFEQIASEVPEVEKFGFTICTESVFPLVDSSQIEPEFWARLVELLEARYDEFDGFVILHGTDTMAYTASALSFMLPALAKPVVLTGSQLPIGAVRTDGKENLLGAIEVAAQQEAGRPVVPEVSVYFNHKLMRGNRASKFGAARFDAFRSFNYPYLAEAGIHIRYNERYIRRPRCGPWMAYKKFDTHVASIKLFPGISFKMIEAVLALADLRGVVIETYGAGNAPARKEFLDPIAEAIQRGVVVVNVTQCAADGVDMKTYDAGISLAGTGVLDGGDMTYEAAIVKLMVAQGIYGSASGVVSFFLSDIAGERSF